MIDGAVRRGALAIVTAVASSVVRTLISLELRLLLTVPGLNEDFRAVVVWVDSNVFVFPFTGYL